MDAIFEHLVGEFVHLLFYSLIRKFEGLSLEFLVMFCEPDLHECDLRIELTLRMSTKSMEPYLDIYDAFNLPTCDSCLFNCTFESIYSLRINPW